MFNSRRGLFLLFLVTQIRAVETPPAELLENLEFFAALDLLENTPSRGEASPIVGPKATEPTSKTKETRHEPSAQKPL